MLKTLALIGLMAFAATTANLSLADDSMSAAEHSAHHASGMMKEPTPEMRQKMAVAHQNMADCLKSTKPVSECKEAMMKECPMMKNGHCEMMDGMGSMKMDHGKKGTGKKAAEDHSAHHPDTE